MGLLITGDLKIKGTDIELTSVYARIKYVAEADGRTISVTFKIYADQSKYEQGEEIQTNINTNSFDFAIEPTEEQSLQVALNYCILKFADYGYNAQIV